MACNLLGGDVSPTIAPPATQIDSPASRPTDLPEPPTEEIPQSNTPQFLASLEVIDSSNSASVRELLVFEAGEITDFSWSPDNAFLAIAYFDRPNIEIWNIFVGEAVNEIGQLTPAVQSVSYATFNDWILTADESEVELWDLLSGEKLENIDEPGIRVSDVEFSPDGRTIALGYESTQGTVVLWDQIDGVAIGTYFHEDSVTDVEFSPFGKLLVTGAANGTVKVIDAVGTQTEVHNLTHASWVDSVAIAFAPPQAGLDGHILASSSSGEIRLWDAISGDELRTLAGHVQDVVSMSFSPNGAVLASGSRDNTIKLWNVVTGEELATLAGHNGELVNVAFSHDGTLLGSGSLDTTLRIWAVEMSETTSSYLATITMENNLDVPVCYVHINASSGDGLDEVLIEEGQPMLPGDTIHVQVPVGQQGDIQIHGCDGRVIDEQFAIEVTMDGVNYSFSPSTGLGED
jgi:WD40 repeat protein